MTKYTILTLLFALTGLVSAMGENVPNSKAPSIIGGTQYIHSTPAARSTMPTAPIILYSCMPWAKRC